MNEQNMDPQAAQQEAEETIASLGTANDRFKEGFPAWFWGSMIAATVVHFSLFKFWPELEAEDVSVVVSEIEVENIQPEIDIPPPPAAVSRPATPLIVDSNLVDDDVTIELTSFEENPVENLPPPPEEVETDISQQYVYTPVQVNPVLRNEADIIRQVERVYPVLLKDAGIGGSPVINFYLDAEGNVANFYLRESSGHKSLDDAALSVAHLFKFSPAMNRDKAVPVWVYLPVTFQPK